MARAARRGLAIPTGVAVDSTGDVFVADEYNHTIRKVTAAGVVTTLAGVAPNPGSADGTAAPRGLTGLAGVAVDSAGDVLVADTGNNTIRKVTAAGVVTTLAGSLPFSGSADGTGRAARFNFPCGAAVDIAGNVFVADNNNHTIPEGDPGGGGDHAGGEWGNSG